MDLELSTFESARIRHDFKHTVHTLKTLADTGDLDAINSYLYSYLSTLPQSESRIFTSNTAVNAVLNYYYRRAAEHGIKTDWDIAYPQSTPIEDSDICSILGNILENALLACSESEAEKSFIDLSISHEPGSAVYIAVANTLGTLKISDGKYLSTHWNGQGIGLRSIKTVAAKYNGTARFSHEDGEFYSEVMLSLE